MRSTTRLSSKERVVLITGIGGFIGAQLSRRLLFEGWKVHGLIRPESRMDLLSGIEDQIQLHASSGGVNSLVEIIQQIKPDLVFHLASCFRAEHSPADIESLIHSNILYGTQLVEAMMLVGVKVIINAGTVWQHYEGKDYSPVSLYAATKQAFEDILVYYSEVKDLRHMTLELCDSYGPGDRRAKIFGILNKAIRMGQPLELSGGDQLVDLVHVQDVVSAFVVASELLLEGKPLQTRYRISSGNPISLKKLAKLFEEVTEKKLAAQWGKRPYRAREMFHSWESGKILPNWRPQVELKDGIREIYEMGNT